MYAYIPLSFYDSMYAAMRTGNGGDWLWLHEGEQEWRNKSLIIPYRMITHNEIWGIEETTAHRVAVRVEAIEMGYAAGHSILFTLAHLPSKTNITYRVYEDTDDIEVVRRRKRARGD